jgi:hypothetical protein
MKGFYKIKILLIKCTLTYLSENHIHVCAQNYIFTTLGSQSKPKELHAILQKTAPLFLFLLRAREASLYKMKLKYGLPKVQYYEKTGKKYSSKLKLNESFGVLKWILETQSRCSAFAI